jgi:hypothetical protein
MFDVLSTPGTTFSLTRDSAYKGLTPTDDIPAPSQHTRVEHVVSSVRNIPWYMWVTPLTAAVFVIELLARNFRQQSEDGDGILDMDEQLSDDNAYRADSDHLSPLLALRSIVFPRVENLLHIAFGLLDTPQ